MSKTTTTTTTTSTINPNETIFSTLPFVKEYLQNQIEAGGGVIYNHFEDIPKNKYKQCKLIAARPCATAKYVQCLAANITVSSSFFFICILTGL